MWVYLWEDGKLIAHDSSSGGSFAKLRPFAAERGSTYVIEVTTSDPVADGRFLLAQRGSALNRAPNSFRFEDHVGEDPPAQCRETLDVENRHDPNDPQRWSNNNRFGAHASAWLEWPCWSVQRQGSYARYYTFQLSEQRTVTFNATASGTHLYLYLRDGNAVSGAYRAESHRPKNANPITARMALTLPAGTYTIEVVQKNPGTGSWFTLAISE